MSPERGLIKAAAAPTMQDNLDHAMHYVGEAVAICSEIKYGEGRAAAMNVLAKVHMKRGADEEGLEKAMDSAADFSRGAAGNAKCEYFDIADSEADDPMEYWDESMVQLAFLGLQESEAKCRRREALYYEANEEDTNSGAAQGPGGCEAIFESFLFDSAEVTLGFGQTLEDDESGSMSGSFSRR